jgi:hypothetical protein
LHQKIEIAGFGLAAPAIALVTTGTPLASAYA